MTKTRNIIIKYMMKNDYEFNILEFNNVSNDFDKIINTDNHLIYLLDFELKETNAIDVARRIRKKDWINPIIVLSVYDKVEYKVLKQRLEILDFVSKNKNVEKDLFELFDICINKINSKSLYRFKSGKSYYNMNYEKILYIYKDTLERKSVIVTESNQYKVGRTLKSIKNELPDYFVYTHKACIINSKKINLINISKREILFENGIKIDLISKAYGKELIKNGIC